MNGNDQLYITILCHFFENNHNTYNQHSIRWKVIIFE